MNDQRRKECYFLFYIVKGHLKYFCDSDLESIHKDYTKRLWYNEETNLYSEGFEEAYQKFKNCCMK